VARGLGQGPRLPVHDRAGTGAGLRELKAVEPTIENVTRDDDRDLINARLRAGASPKTIANYHGLLSAVFRDAQDKDLVARNRCSGVKLPARDDDIDDDEDKGHPHRGGVRPAARLRRRGLPGLPHSGCRDRPAVR
jgi:hypothetical protein